MPHDSIDPSPEPAVHDPLRRSLVLRGGLAAGAAFGTALGGTALVPRVIHNVG